MSCGVIRPRVGDADGAETRVSSLRSVHEVAGAAVALRGRVEAADQPLVLRRDAGRAVVGVALLGLDAADRHHRLAADVDHVGTERERDDGVLRAGRACRSR